MYNNIMMIAVIALYYIAATTVITFKLGHLNEEKVIGINVVNH